jgi:hypothetical protein
MLATWRLAAAIGQPAFEQIAPEKDMSIGLAR